MTLGINTEPAGGDFLPVLKYNADAGKLLRQDRVQDQTGNFQTVEREMPAGSRFAIDFGAIEVGWALFTAGQAPAFAMVPLGGPRPERPAQTYREGFRTRVWSPELGLREMSATSKTLVGAIDEVHVMFEGTPEAQAGQIPIVTLVGTRPITIQTPKGKKTTWRPDFQISGWMARIAEMGDRTVPAPAPRGTQAAQTFQQPPSQQPPAAQPQQWQQPQAAQAQQWQQPQATQAPAQQPQAGWQQPQAAPPPAAPQYPPNHVGPPGGTQAPQQGAWQQPAAQQAAPAPSAHGDWGMAAATTRPAYVAAGSGGQLEDDAIPF